MKKPFLILLALMVCLQTAAVFANDSDHVAEDGRLFSPSPEIKYATGLIQDADSAKRKIRGPYEVFLSRLEVETPDVLDYRTQGLSEVLDQGNCGSCWAQATTGALTDVLKLKGTYPGQLSPEYAKNCHKDSYGCGGGFFDAFEIMIDPYVVPTLAELPYVPSNVRRPKCEFQDGGSALEWFYVGGPNSSPSDEEIVKALNLYGPGTIDIAATSAYMQQRGAAPYTACNGRGVNHMEEIVGYKRKKGAVADSKGNYSPGEIAWILKNSWGKSRGENGYDHIYARGANGAKCNQVATTAAFLRVKEVPKGPQTIRVENESAWLEAVIQPEANYSVDDARREFQMMIDALEI